LRGKKKKKKKKKKKQKKKKKKKKNNPKSARERKTRESSRPMPTLPEEIHAKCTVRVTRELQKQVEKFLGLTGGW